MNIFFLKKEKTLEGGKRRREGKGMMLKLLGIEYNEPHWIIFRHYLIIQTKHVGWPFKQCKPWHSKKLTCSRKCCMNASKALHFKCPSSCLWCKREVLLVQIQEWKKKCNKEKVAEKTVNLQETGVSQWLTFCFSTIWSALASRGLLEVGCAQPASLCWWWLYNITIYRKLFPHPVS